MNSQLRDAIRYGITAVVVIAIFTKHGPLLGIFSALVSVAIELLTYQVKQLDANLAKTLRAFRLTEKH